MIIIPLFEDSGIPYSSISPSIPADLAAKIRTAMDAFDKEDEKCNKIEDEGGKSNPYSICTNGARWLKKNFFPKADVKGYTIDDNPRAEIGKDTMSGHDFLVLDGRYIIDFWYSMYRYKKNAPSAIDMKTDKKLLTKYYGNPKKWIDMN